MSFFTLNYLTVNYLKHNSYLSFLIFNKFHNVNLKVSFAWGVFIFHITFKCRLDGNGYSCDFMSIYDISIYSIMLSPKP